MADSPAVARRGFLTTALSGSGTLDLGPLEVEFNRRLVAAGITIDANGVITFGVSPVGVSASPAGSNTQVQFNDAGTLAGDAGMTYNKTTDTLTVTNIAGAGAAITGVPISTGVSGLGTGVATFLATPSSANLAAAVTDETGSGALVLATSPTLVTPALGTPASGVLTNCTGLPTAGLVNDAVTYAKMQNVSAASRLLGRGSAGGAGDPEELTVVGLTLSGTVLSTGAFGLSATAAASALTVALTAADGSTPSTAAPVVLRFRSATAGTGSLTDVTVTAATTVVVPDTATLGTSNSVPFKAWIVAFNDSGTVRLGIINCANSTSVYPLSGWGIASSTTISTGADSAQVFYSDAGVTSKAYVVLGYVTYESGLATAGTYTSAPTRVQVYGTDVPLPGRAVQTVITNYATQTASTTSTYADTGSTATITPTSAANRVIVRAGVGGVYKDTADQSVNIQLLRTATQLGFQRAGANAATGANGVGSVTFTVLDHPQSSSAITYKTQFAAGGNTNNVYVQQGSSQSYVELVEVES